MLGVHEELCDRVEVQTTCLLPCINLAIHIGLGLGLGLGIIQ